jgi:hypothetical protein
LSSTGISITIPRTREGASEATSSVVFAADDRVVELEVIEQGHDLAREDRHRIAPHVAGPVGASMPQQIEGDDPVALVGEVAGKRLVHPARQEQARQEHEAAAALTVDLV